jgi:3',5'-cyclic-AMP phosphodiesterase
MTRAAWLTDIHLNFLGTVQLTRFVMSIREQEPDVILISGDIGEARSFVWYLKTLEQKLQKPIYYVLGNHDFYMGSVADVRDMARKLSHESNKLVWLPDADITELAPGIGLVGHDSWADGRLGDYKNTPLMLNDFVLIHDLAGLTSEDRLQRLNALGDEAADYFRGILPRAFERYHHVVVVTHVPPFVEACRYEGKLSDDDALPFFACKAVGDVLLEIMQAHPDRQVTVLCGHTHEQALTQVLDNLLVFTGGAEYSKPIVQHVFEF